MSLPILSSAFFQKHQPDVGFFSKWQSFHSWSDRMIPIYEWNQVLYVGCSVPPSPVPQFNQPVVFVLCEPEVLKKIWYEFQGTVVLDADFRKSLSVPQAPKIEDAPDGLSLDLSVPSAPADEALNFLDELAVVENESKQVDPLEDSLVSEDSLEFPDFMPQNPLSDKTAVMSKDDFQSTFPTEKELSPASVLLEDTQDIELDEALLEESSPEIESPAHHLRTIVNEATSLQVRPKATAQAQAPEQRATPVKSEVVHNSKASKSFEELTKSSVTGLTGTHGAQMDASIPEYFRELEAHFEKVMVLLKNGDLAKPWKWNQAFQAPAGAGTGYTLMQPSPLRIVYRTHMPYHGYVVPNETNQKFFKEWNGSQTPDHLTVAPLIIDDKVVGMLLGISSQVKKNNESLLVAQKIAEKISAQLKSRTSALSAA